jgi:hypothetical protein
MYIDYDDQHMYLGFFGAVLGGKGVTPIESRYGIEMILICREYFGRDCKMTHSYYHHLFLYWVIPPITFVNKCIN